MGDGWNHDKVDEGEVKFKSQTAEMWSAFCYMSCYKLLGEVNAFDRNR